MISKKCFRCEGIHSLFEFSVDKSKKDGRSIYCRNCRRKIGRNVRALPDHNAKKRKNAHRYKDYNRNYMLKQRYGITMEDFNNIFKAQNQSCKICGSEKSDGRNFVVDHSHKTGKIRGILCNLCNIVLGSLREDLELIKKIEIYLSKESHDV